ncbi:RNA polymerase subunit sigma-70 [Streptomyces cinnamoneus]|uniref:RNA polymerase subunit sigma-70 n=1 Tax=Streptomyces cinnamoneus TaxID=53446 RepID=UPI0033C0F807
MSQTPDQPDPFRSTIEALAATPDPIGQARAVGAALDAVPDLQKELRGMRQAAVLELRKTMSVAEVAEALGISVPRVSQIAKGVSRTVKR